MKLKLATELFERFKGHVYYHWVVEYADVDTFKLMEEPRVSFDYKIVF
jgi:predicted HTH domain antitoxin